MIETTVIIRGEEITYKWISYIDENDKRLSDWSRHEVCDHCNSKIVHVMTYKGKTVGRDCLENMLNNGTRPFVDLKKITKNQIEKDHHIRQQAKINELDTAEMILNKHKRNVEHFKTWNMSEELDRSQNFVNEWTDKVKNMKLAIKKDFGINF